MPSFANWLPRIAALALLAALAGKPGTAQAAPRDQAEWDSPVAVVNGEAITRADLAYFLLAVQGDDWLRAAALRKAVSQEAEERGLEITPDEIEQHVSTSVEARLQSLAKTYGMSPEEHAQALRMAGQDVDAIRASLRAVVERTAEAEMLAESLMRSDIVVTEDDVRRAFEEEYGPKVRVRHIELASIGDAMEVSQALERGAGFDRLAEDRTLDRPSRQRNFEMLPSPSPTSAIGRRAASLEPGRRAIVREGERFHVIELIDRVDELMTLEGLRLIYRRRRGVVEA